MDLARIFFLAARRVTKVFYRLKGFARIAEQIRKLSAFYKQSILIKDFDGDIKIYCSLNEHMSSQIFWRGYYSYGQLKLLASLLTRDSVFVDAGANQGEFTLFAAKRCVDGKALSFEPVPEALGKLKRNINENAFKNITVYAQGLGSSSRQCPVYASKGVFSDGTAHEGLFTVHPTGQRGDRLCDIEVVKMDEVNDLKMLNRLDVIKIDVEGSELDVLKGAGDTIKKFRPVIIMELADENCRSAGYTPEDLIKYLKDLSYNCETINDDGTTLPGAVFCSSGAAVNLVCYPLKYTCQN